MVRNNEFTQGSNRKGQSGGGGPPDAKINAFLLTEIQKEKGGNGRVKPTWGGGRRKKKKLLTHYSRNRSTLLLKQRRSRIRDQWGGPGVGEIGSTSDDVAIYTGTLGRRTETTRKELIEEPNCARLDAENGPF